MLTKNSTFTLHLADAFIQSVFTWKPIPDLAVDSATLSKAGEFSQFDS